MSKKHRGYSELQKEFINDFQKLCRTRNAWTAWQDFVDVAAYAIANAVDTRKDVKENREAAYLQIVKKYSKEEFDIFCDLFTYIIMALERNAAQDFLGEVYMNLNFGGKSGQFFTPWTIAELMARMTIGDDLKQQIAQKGYASLVDPSCGAGCMLMSFAHVCKSTLDVNYQRDILFVGQDVDPIVAKMCYIQLSLLGCAGYVVIGDTIANPVTGMDLFPNYKDDYLYFTPMWFSPDWTVRRMLAQYKIQEIDTNMNMEIIKEG